MKAPIAPTTGLEPQVFTGTVSAASRQGPALSDAQVTVDLTTSATPGEICFSLKLHGNVSNGCAGPELIRTGLTFGSYLDHGVLDVIGIVPDDVSTVVVGGTQVAVKNNVWHYSGKDTDSGLTLRVASADGKAVATTG